MSAIDIKARIVSALENGTPPSVLNASLSGLSFRTVGEVILILLCDQHMELERLRRELDDLKAAR